VSGHVISGRAWVFGQADLNTEVIMPRAGYDVPPQSRRDLILSSVRPGWAAQVRTGDVLVAGQNFGIGSSRPVVTFLAELGIAGIVAESIASIFYRNCVSYAMPALECDNVLAHVGELDEVSFDIATGELTNLATGAVLNGRPIPPALAATIDAGGTFAQLAAAGYLAAHEVERP
jgi:3-isopropylmalate/(R)-2-methylmalate dehydratase small subunit